MVGDKTEEWESGGIEKLSSIRWAGEGKQSQSKSPVSVICLSDCLLFFVVGCRSASVMLCYEQFHCCQKKKEKRRNNSNF